MCAKSVDLALFHYDDAIRILHAGDTLGDDQLRRIRDLLPKCPSDLGIRRGVDRAGTVVKDQDLRFLQQRSRNTKPLFLSA